MVSSNQPKNDYFLRVFPVIYLLFVGLAFAGTKPYFPHEYKTVISEGWDQAENQDRPEGVLAAGSSKEIRNSAPAPGKLFHFLFPANHPDFIPQFIHYQFLAYSRAPLTSRVKRFILFSCARLGGSEPIG